MYGLVTQEFCGYLLDKGFFDFRLCRWNFSLAENDPTAFTDFVFCPSLSS